MSGKIVTIAIVVGALIFGAALYYTQVYGYYHDVAPRPGQDVKLVSRATGRPESIPYAGFRAIDAESSPLRYRACFITSADPDALSRSHVAAPGRLPRSGPGWFGCFDAEAIGKGIETGALRVFMGQKNIAYGVDRIVAISGDGHGYVWHDLNQCGDKAWDGTPLGEDCPPRPDGEGQ
ncbi:MAG: DUF6446 family protein [Jhaorihella sp.]